MERRAFKSLLSRKALWIVAVVAAFVSGMAARDAVVSELAPRAIRVERSTEFDLDRITAGVANQFLNGLDDFRAGGEERRQTHTITDFSFLADDDKILRVLLLTPNPDLKTEFVLRNKPTNNPHFRRYEIDYRPDDEDDGKLKVVFARPSGMDKIDLPSAVFSGSEDPDGSVGPLRFVMDKHTAAEWNRPRLFSFAGESLQGLLAWQRDTARSNLLRIMVGDVRGDSRIHLEDAEAGEQGSCQEVTIDLPGGESATGRLYLPDTEGRKSPAVLVLPGHGSSGEYFLFDKSGAGKAYAAFVLSTEHLPKGGANCLMGARLLAARAAFNFLATHPEIDGSRVAVFGHSMGGELATYLAATEPRVEATFVSGAFPFNIFPEGFKRNSEGMYKGRCDCTYVPGLRAAFRDQDILAMVAPRDIAFEIGWQDSINPTKPVLHNAARTSPIYRMCGNAAGFKVILHPGVRVESADTMHHEPHGEVIIGMIEEYLGISERDTE